MSYVFEFTKDHVNRSLYITIQLDLSFISYTILQEARGRTYGPIPQGWVRTPRGEHGISRLVPKITLSRNRLEATLKQVRA